jgi:hypothetical protein
MPSHVSDIFFFVHSSEYLLVRGCQTIVYDNVIGIMIKYIIRFEFLTALSIQICSPLRRDVI